VLVDPTENPSPFLLTGTEVRGCITGPIAHVEVTQAWENPNDDPVDGLYVFPLPENAAVTDMTLRIGHRTIQGEMRRREEAHRIYEAARQEGRVAGLLDQERPNLFAQRVANLAPGARVEVVIAFDEEIHCNGPRCEFVFPTVVGPRFIPLRQTDPGAIDPPVVAPGASTRQRFSLVVDLEPGVPVQRIESPSHAIVVRDQGRYAQRITLSENGGERLNKDFRLSWRVGSDRPELGLMAWREPGRTSEPGVFTLMFQPPQDPAETEMQPRELVFVLDCSGSMMGVPLEAAKDVVRRALGAVRPEDTFQIIRFSDSASGLGSRSLSPTRENLRRALEYLDSLRGEGGTEMVSGIRAALGFPADPQRLRIVAFLTDGYIGNEREILAEVARKIGGARLFSFGIGSSVNRYLLEGLAEEGRGEAAFLGAKESPDQMVERFVERISSPLLTDIRITWRDVEVMDLVPNQEPDLFAGQPLILHGRYRRPGTGAVEVEGFSRGRRRVYRCNVTLPEAAEDHEALGRLWARSRIHQMERQLHDSARPEVVEAIATLGIRHHLMTAYTSLVAVDSEISNWTGHSSQVSVPVEMPEDVAYEGIFGDAKAKESGYVVQRNRQAPPPPGAISGFSSSGYSGPVSERDRTARQESGARKDSPESLPETRKGPDVAQLAPLCDEDRERRPSFTRLTLYESDGNAIAIEADGKVFRVESGRRAYVKTLEESAMESIRKALTAAGTNRWQGGGSGARLVLEAQGLTRVAGLAQRDESVQALAALLRALAS